MCGCSLTSIYIYVLLEKKRKITESLEVFPCLLPSRTSPTTNLEATTVLHYWCYSSSLISLPPQSLILHIPITLPSYCPFSAPPLCLHPSYYISISGVTVPFCLVTLPPCVHFLSFVHSLIAASVNLFLLPFSSSISNLIVLLSFFFSPARCSGQLTYGSPFTSETQGIPWTHRPDSHPRQEQPIDTDADALHSAVEQWGQGVKGERSQATDQQQKLRLQGFRKREGQRDSEKLSGRSVSVTDEGQGIEDDDFTRKAEAGEGEPGWVWIADERWICMRLSPCIRLRLYMCVCLHTWLHTRQHTGSHAWMCALRSHPHTPTQIYITHTVFEHMCAYSNLSSVQSKGRRAEKLA